MDPSDRIRIITEVSRRLAGEEWPIIDLTLKQFGLPVADSWGGEKSAYIVGMSSNANDETLGSLARHVGYDYEPSRSRVEPNFWSKGYFRLFISHLAAFREEAGLLQTELMKFGVSCFVAHNDIEPTAEWQNEIESGLATADAALALLRPEFHSSNWTDQELGYAMGRGILIVAVRLGGNPYGFMSRFQALSGMAKSSDVLSNEIFEVLLRHKQTRRRISEALVSVFEDSSSYSSAKWNMSLLERTAYWDASLTERAREAVKTNSQVRESFGVPDRVKKLISDKGTDLA